MTELSHFDADGASHMVDVSEKAITLRMARSRGQVAMRAETLAMIRDRKHAKGDVLEVARLAGIMAAKRTDALIPLCHGLPLEAVSIAFDFPDEQTVGIEATARVSARTGVEMESLVAVSMTALTIYDMCKAVDRAMVIGPIQLEEKTGGQSGPLRQEQDMSQVVNGKTASRERLQAIYQPIRQELEAVEKMLRGELRSDHAFVDQLVKHGFRLGGKRLRPALLLLSAKAVGKTTDEHITLATVVEMIHTATLVHDDVLDEATLRRHEETVNARWDNEASVLLGDFLFSHSFYLASTLSSTFACQTIGRATNVTCEGEMRQLNASGSFDLDEQAYLGIIAAKTGELCACSCLLGAHYANATADSAESMADYGRNLGIAFQITDDLLDVIGDENTMGKSLGTDLQKRKATLPMIHLMQQLSEAEREDLLSQLDQSPETCAEVLIPWLERYGSLEYARDKAAWYAQQAANQLAALPESESRETLHRMTEFVVNRHR